MSRPSPSTRFSLIPVLLLAASFAVGIAAAFLLPIDLWTATGIGALSCILACLFRRSLAGTILIWAAFAAAGAVAFTAEKQSVRHDRIKVLYDSGAIVSGQPVEIEGVLSGRPELSSEGKFLTFKTERLKYKGEDRLVTGKVRLFLPASGNLEHPHLKHGSRVIVNCVLNRENQYLNPGVIRVPELLDQLGIDAFGSVKSSLLIEHVADESVFLPLAWIYDRRAELIDDFMSELSPAAAGIMTASLLGDKHFLDRDTAEVFREGGTFHVLVISGLHITFIGGILLLIVRGFTRNRWVQFLTSTCVLWAYTLAVGADVPVVRAAVMFTIVMLSYVLYRPSNMLNSLGVCALVLLAWRPSDLFNPSFQLTFISVAAIVAVAYPLIDRMHKIGAWSPTVAAPFPPNVPGWLRRSCETLYWNDEKWQYEKKRQIWTASLYKSPYMPGRIKGVLQKFLRYLTEGIVVSMIVQICMLPLLVAYFHRVSLVSIVLNLWVGFFIAIESIAVVIAVLFKSISPLLAAPLLLLAEAVNWVMLSVPRLITGHSWPGFRLPAYSGPGRIVYLLYFAALIGIAYGLYLWDPWRPMKPFKSLLGGSGIALAVLFLLIVFHPFSAPLPDGRLKIDFLDVGQGDAALVTFPNGQTMLVDGGGRMRFPNPNDEETQPFEPDVRRLGESVVSEFLWERGYSEIGYILATHADTDHMQGLADVARNFSVTNAIIGQMPVEDPDYDELRAVLESRRIETSIASAGDIWNVGGVSIEVLFPPAEDGVTGLSNNDSSIVLRITYGQRSFLLTGDIESTAEATLTASGVSLPADVIKVPHHGSRTSSTSQFVASVRPRIAVIPVGRRSPFGHPHPEVVDRWRATGADVRTTGEKGMVTISTDGSDLQISTFIP